MTRLLFASVFICLVFLTSCGTQGEALQLRPADPRAVAAEDAPADENPEGWSTHWVRQAQRVGGSYSLLEDYPGDPGYDVLLGEQSWAVFAWDPGPLDRVASVQVLSRPQTEEQAAAGETPGEFWVGLEFKLGGRWELYGPFAAGEQPLFGDSNPALGEPEFFWWFKGNTRVAVFATEEVTLRGLAFTTRAQ